MKGLLRLLRPMDEGFARFRVQGLSLFWGVQVETLNPKP